MQPWAGRIRSARISIAAALDERLLGLPCALRDHSFRKNAAIWRHSLAGRLPKLRFEEGAWAAAGSAVTPVAADA
jgi:hypothetical protein